MVRALLPAVTFCALVVLAEVPEHRVTSLPGLQGDLGSRHWSGYVPVRGPQQEPIHMHYWLIESAKGLLNAPTVVWHQGGPGGSSMIALFTENGPFTLNDDSYHTEDYNRTKIPSVFLNPHSWHSSANMLYVDHPAPTGFSYCDDDQCPHWNDSTQAQTNYEFLVSFFSSYYPELASSPFYFSGESYAGVLVPMTVLEIQKHTNASNQRIAPWSLQGFILGNACPGNRVFTCTPYSGWAGVQVAVDFRYGHGMISEDTYAAINKACADDFGRYEPPENTECRKLIGDDPARPVMEETGDTYAMGGGYYLYSHCNDDLLQVGEDGMPFTQRDFGKYPIQENGNADSHGVYKCGQERASSEWLNLKAVQESIHVRVGQFQFSTALDYNFTKFSLLEEYKTSLIPNYQIWQYSGDADPCVPHVGTARWMKSLGFKTTRSWAPWKVRNQVAGYSTAYASGGKAKDFTFVTMRDAGHMVPRYKPERALEMFNAFLEGKSL